MAVGAMVIATKYSGDAKVLVEDSGYGMILDEIENISSEMIDELNLKIHSYKENKEYHRRNSWKAKLNSIM